MTLSLQSFAIEDPKVMEKKRFDKPVRDISLIYTTEGYYPTNFSVFSGEVVRFYLTATTKDPGCLIMPEKNIFMSAEKGQIAETQVYFDKPGTHKFYCPNGKIFGRVTVLEKPEVVRARAKNKLKREIASKNTKVLLWKPREHEGAR